MKKIILILLIAVAFSLSSCSWTNSNQGNDSNSSIRIDDDNNQGGIDKTDSKERAFTMKIDDTVVDITWENNDSVNELMEYARDGLTIEMYQYGGFEQVGSIGKTITRSDSQITTIPGDVVLYSGNQIVIFYGSNSWSYTKLGHINLDQDGLNDLLNKSNVTLKLENK
mgnify:CR=1 FL=1